MADTSFLPEDYLEKRLQRRTNFICFALFIVVMSAVVGAFLVTDRQRGEVRVMQKQVNGQFEAAAQRLKELTQLQQRKSQMVRKAQVTAVLVERVDRPTILSELINAMPEAVGLTEFNLESKAVKNSRTLAASALDEAKKKAGKTPDEPEAVRTDVSITVQGLAPSDVEVAQFMAALSRCKLFTDLNLAFSEQATVHDVSMRKFRIDMALIQDLDMSKFERTMIKRGMHFNGAETVIRRSGTGSVVPVNDGSH
jgi:Tfp pilus assembly protein PilN